MFKDGLIQAGLVDLVLSTIACTYALKTCY